MTARERAEMAAAELRRRWPGADIIRVVLGEAVEVLLDWRDPVSDVRLGLWPRIVDGACVGWSCEVMHRLFVVKVHGETATDAAEAGLRALVAMMRDGAAQIEARANVEGGAP